MFVFPHRRASCPKPRRHTVCYTSSSSSSSFVVRDNINIIQCARPRNVRERIIITRYNIVTYARNNVMPLWRRIRVFFIFFFSKSKNANKNWLAFEIRSKVNRGKKKTHAFRIILLLQLRNIILCVENNTLPWANNNIIMIVTHAKV